MNKRFKFFSLALLAGSLTSTSAFAVTVGSGMFNLGGTVQGAANGLNFFLSVPSPADQKALVLLPTQGAFSDLASTTVESVKNLTTANGVVPGTSFNFVNWITLTDGINLDATAIPIPVLPACSGDLITTGCLVAPTSPVVLKVTNNVVTAGLLVDGVAHFAGQTDLTPFVGTFTSTNTGYSSITAFETAFFGAGVTPIAYQANFITTAPITTPEPAAILLASCGLVGLGLLRRRKASR